MPAAPFTYKVDTRNLRDDFKEAPYVKAVNQVITQIGIADGDQKPLRDSIIGMLLLDGHDDQSSFGFATQIRRLWGYVQADLLDSNGRRIPGQVRGTFLTNKDAIDQINTKIDDLRTGQVAFYQELAAVARQIIDGHRGEIIRSAILRDGILLESAVSAALQGYGSGTGSSGSFELPPLSDPTMAGSSDEIIPDHVRGVAVLYAALQLELLGLFKVLDRNVEIFMNGQLPVADDLGGNALNMYYWDSVNRMSESARWMQYSRVLGAKGGEVSREVAPNVGFDETFFRFLSALSEHDRQQRVGDLLGNARGLNITGEHVRKAGRDLAANCTLFGYGYTQFAAKRMQQHIVTALNILKLPDVQQAWGVQSAWQVVERVSAQEFHATPNVVKYRTMAESGKKVLDLVAQVGSVWSAMSDKPLFASPQSEVAALISTLASSGSGTPIAGASTGAGRSGASRARGNADIPREIQDQLMRHTEYWLAVNGIKDEAVSDSAQPSDTAYSPSIPSLDGTNGSNGSNPDLAGQIQQMLQQGQTPSPDQLRRMVGI